MNIVLAVHTHTDTHLHIYKHQLLIAMKDLVTEEVVDKCNHFNQ